MLTPSTVGGLKQSLKCVMRCGPHRQCPGYVVVSVTEQAYQHLIPLNTLEQLSQFQFWTIFFLSLTSSLVHIKNCFSWSILGAISVGYRRSCNCVQCGDESRGAICCRAPKCVFSLAGVINNWYTKWKSEEKVHGSNLLPSTLSSNIDQNL